MIPYNDLPPAITPEESEEIINRIKNDKVFSEDRDKLINGYLRMTWAIAYKVCKSYGIYFHSDHKANDVLDAGVVKLCEKVDRILAKKIEVTNEYYKYLNKAISRHCQFTLRNFRIYSIPQSTIRSKIKKGMNDKKEIVDEVKDLSEAAISVIALLPPMYQNEMKILAKSVSLSDLKHAVRMKLLELLTYNNFATIKADYINNEEGLSYDYKGRNYIVAQAKKEEPGIEVKEILDQATYTLREDKIIKLRAEGMTYKEIGKLYSMTEVAVFHIVDRVRNRFDPIWDKE